MNLHRREALALPYQHLGAPFLVPCPLQSSLSESLPHTGLRRPATITFSGVGLQSGLVSSGGWVMRRASVCPKHLV